MILQSLLVRYILCMGMHDLSLGALCCVLVHCADFLFCSRAFHAGS